MITSNLQEEREKILKSNLIYLSHPNQLQIGRKFIVIDVCHPNNKKSCFDYNKNYSVIQILSVTPKLDKTKIDNTLTYDRLAGDGRVFFEEAEKKDFDFHNYIQHGGYFYSVCNDCMKYGWMYFEVEYQNVYSKEIKTDIVSLNSHNICFEMTKKNPWSNSYEDEENWCERIFATDVFEYDTEIIKSNVESYPDRIKLLADNSIKESIYKLLETELYDYVISNYKCFLAQNILSNKEIIDDNDTIKIDGLTWYNGFHNDFKGVRKRDYLFYDYIPFGWRLPTVDELLNMLDKHPLLRKEIADDDKMVLRRNNAGMECQCSTYFKSDDLNVMTLDSNDYTKEECYFPCEIKTVNLCTNEIINMTPCCYTWNNNYRRYLILLVKMSEDEIAKITKWATDVLQDTFKYDTINSIYKQYGIDNMDDITGISFDVNVNGNIKKFEKNQNNKHLDALKDAIAKYIGNNDVYNANKIDITFKDSNGNSGALNYNSSMQCDMRTFLTRISPLLCHDLCVMNINSLKELTNFNNYHRESNINAVKNIYSEIRVPLDMYFYIKDSLNQIGIDHDRLFSEECRYGYNYYPGVAYISNLVLHMTNGKDIEIKSLPIECFNQSMLYINEIADKSKYSDGMKTYMKKVMTVLKQENDNK